MYTSLGRQRGEELAVGVPARQVLPVEAHRGDRWDFLGRLELAARTAAQDAEAAEPFRANLLSWATDERNLYAAWRYLEGGDGKAPGADGITYADVPEEYLWPTFRSIRDELRNGTYQPRPLLEENIPKDSGHGYRTLELPSIWDRMVGRAIVQAIQPFLDPGFDARSYGYRPRLGRLHALVEAEVMTITGNRWVWIGNDIRNAFHQVPRQRLLDIVHRYLRDERLVRVIGQLAAREHRRGIPQGQPLCPLLLNLYLDHFLDRVWRQRHPDIPLLRVADDLLVLCRTREEAEAADAELRAILLPAGMPLKFAPQTAIRDLGRGISMDWLGYQLRQDPNGLLQARFSERSWGRLEAALDRCHRKPNPPVRATQTIVGWLKQGGPAYEEHAARDAVRRVRSLARSHAFEDLPSRDELRDVWANAYERWQGMRIAGLERAVSVARCGGSAHRDQKIPASGSGESDLGSPPPG